MQKTTLLKFALKNIGLPILLAAGVTDAVAQVTKKTEIPQFSQGRWGGMSFTVDNKIYVVGGYAGTSSGWLNDVNMYDPATGQWTLKNYMPGTNTNRSAGVSFVLNGKAYVGLGAKNFLTIDPSSFPESLLNDLLEYDPANDKWTQKQSLADGGRTDASVFVINNKAYIVGGNKSTGAGGATNQVWEYDGSKWTAKAPFPEADIANAYAFTINGKGYIMGGEVGTTISKKTYEYNPATDKWTAKADFCDSARFGGEAFVFGGKGYIALGSTGAGYSRNFYVYNPTADYWSFVADKWIAAGRSFGVTEVVNGKAYMGCGWRYDQPNQTFFKDWYEVDVAKMLSIDNTVNEGKKLECYPNPATDVVYISMPVNGNIADYQYAVYSLTGQKMLSGNMDNSRAIAIGSLAAGQYILEARGAAESFRGMLSVAGAK